TGAASFFAGGTTGNLVFDGATPQGWSTGTPATSAFGRVLVTNSSPSGVTLASGAATSRVELSGGRLDIANQALTIAGDFVGTNGVLDATDLGSQVTLTGNLTMVAGQWQGGGTLRFDGATQNWS